MKLLSIIVPMYNSEKWLHKCVESLLHQDISSEMYEIILVDDGSPDGSRVIAEKYAADHTNIIVLTRPNGGTSAARNTGIRAANGKYLYFVDPDDYILDNSLRGIIDKMESEKLDVLRFGYIEVDEDGNEIQSVKHPVAIDYSAKVMDGYTFMGERLGAACYVWTYIFRTKIIKDNNIYCEEGAYFDDTTWLPLVLAKAKRVDSIDYRRHFYLIRSDSLVRAKDARSIRKKMEGERYLIKELQRQNFNIENVFARNWYNMMLAYCTLSLLSLVGVYDFKCRNTYIKELKELKVFPLSRYRLSRRNSIKTIFINFSPTLFCWYCHVR